MKPIIDKIDWIVFIIGVLVFFYGITTPFKIQESIMGVGFMLLAIGYKTIFRGGK